MFPRSQPLPVSCVLVAASTITLPAVAATEGGSSVSPGTLPSTHLERGTDPVGPAVLPLIARLEEAEPPSDRPKTAPTASGLRTDRLSSEQRDRWASIERLVFAEDGLGGPLHPTLRGMWEEVAASDHELYVELPAVRRSGYRVAGLFQVESVRDDGHIVAVLRLDLEMIDRATVGESRESGFRRFLGLGPEGRYAEVLGHELGHAVWTLADPARAREALALRSRPLELARSLPKADPDEREEILHELGELGAQAEAQEVPARAAEARVWEELIAAQTERGMQSASLSTSGRDEH